MPRRITGRRFARSALQAQGPSADGSGGVTVILDFDLAALEGIEIIAVTGFINAENTSFGAADLGDNADVSVHELHLEPGTIVDNGLLAPADIGVLNVDQDAIFTQHLFRSFVGGAATESGSMDVHITPTGRVSLVDETTREGVFTAQNITHRAEAESNNSDAMCLLIVEYYRVVFTIQEVGILNLRRG